MQMGPLSKYPPVMLHLFPATRILNGNPENWLMSEDILAVVECDL